MSRRKRIVQSKYFINDNKDENSDRTKENDDIDYKSSLSSNLPANKRKCTLKTKIDSGSKSKKKQNIESRSTKTKENKYNRNNNSPKPDVNEENNNNDDDDDDNDEWEEVEEAKVFDLQDYQPELPESIQISFDNSNTKIKKKTDPIEAAIRQRINKFMKENQVYMHKCSFLLSIYRLQYLNSLIGTPMTQALNLSLIDLVPKSKPKEPLSKFISKFTKWFQSYFSISLINEDVAFDVNEELISSFNYSTIKYPLILTLIMITFLRSMNVMTRLCYLLNPVPIKPPNLFIIKKSSNSKSKTDKQLERINEHFWMEIFDEQNNKWIFYDFLNQIYDNPKELSVKISKIITYVLAIDNNNNISEVTARYSIDWISREMKKRRINDSWLEETLDIFKNKNYSKYEDADKVEFEKLVSEIELPKKYSDYKNHPLFVLTRDLLKFQAIYPSDAPPLGFFRDEPVYSRNCVHVLKSRETWLRDARTVQLNEKPYKIVTSKFKWKKTMPGEVQEKEMLELFGEWQTCPYEPPVAKNGIVPRNAYGNVDLYQSCMLPIGTVHLQLPGLLRIANKLNIDCVPAIVGFEGTCGGAHPVIDGFVVCTEHKDILVDAWNQEQRIKQEKDEEKRQKRVYENWKRLIRGLIIKRNLKIKYG